MLFLAAIPGTTCGEGCQGICVCAQTCICPDICGMKVREEAYKTLTSLFILFLSRSADDGNRCTIDTCDNNVNGAGCTHRTHVCDDHDQCTVDTCDVSTGM